jgi:hypothetical protein
LAFVLCGGIFFLYLSKATAAFDPRQRDIFLQAG